VAQRKGWFNVWDKPEEKSCLPAHLPLPSPGFTLVWTLPTYQPAVMGVDYGTGEEVTLQEAGNWQGQQNSWLIAVIVFTCVTPISLHFTVPMVSHSADVTHVASFVDIAAQSCSCALMGCHGACIWQQEQMNFWSRHSENHAPSLHYRHAFFITHRRTSPLGTRCPCTPAAAAAALCLSVRQHLPAGPAGPGEPGSQGESGRAGSCQSPCK
jgi:hypothetical protein